MKSRYGKRIVAAALVACMAFSLAGCGGKRKINDGTFRPVDEAELAFPLKEKADITGMISYPANTESEPNKRTIFKRLQEATNVEVKWTAIQSDQWADKISLNMSDPNKLTDRGCDGAPDWIVEIISPATSSNDYVRKLNLYMDAGVKEYWIVDPLKKWIYVYHLEENRFETTPYTFQDRIKVNIYDDLWIDFIELGL